MSLRRASGRSDSTTRSRSMVEKCHLGHSSQQPPACSHSPLHRGRTVCPGLPRDTEGEAPAWHLVPEVADSNAFDPVGPRGVADEGRLRQLRCVLGRGQGARAEAGGANLRSQGALRCAEGATASPSRSQPPLPHRLRCRATPHRALSAQPQPDRVVRPLCGRLALGAAYMFILDALSI